MYNPYLEDHHDALAARYALGVATDTEKDIAERLLNEDSAFCARVAEYRSLFADIDGPTEPVEPPARLWDRIERSIDEAEATKEADSPQAWESLAPGIDRCTVRRDLSAGIEIVVYRVAPLASLVLPDDLTAMDCLVLEGEIEVDGVGASDGERLVALGATGQGLLTSRTGALLYVRAGLRHSA